MTFPPLIVRFGRIAATRLAPLFLASGLCAWAVEDADFTLFIGTILLYAFFWSIGRTRRFDA